MTAKRRVGPADWPRETKNNRVSAVTQLLSNVCLLTCPGLLLDGPTSNSSSRAAAPVAAVDADTTNILNEVKPSKQRHVCSSNSCWVDPASRALLIIDEVRDEVHTQGQNLLLCKPFQRIRGPSRQFLNAHSIENMGGGST